MPIGNSIVSALLRSPFHPVLSGSTDLIRYTGRRSARQFTTPTQYALHGDDVIILVGRPDTKKWWRNFVDERDIEVLIRGRWILMTARAVVGADEPTTIAPLLRAYVHRFPKAARSIGGGGDEARAQHAVVVWCHPRNS
jgi:F420H(2)-dependent quinone reductase